jgi:hypothetical protein
VPGADPRLRPLGGPLDELVDRIEEVDPATLTMSDYELLWILLDDSLHLREPPEKLLPRNHVIENGRSIGFIVLEKSYQTHDLTTETSLEPRIFTLRRFLFTTRDEPLEDFTKSQTPAIAS